MFKLMLLAILFLPGCSALGLGLMNTGEMPGGSSAFCAAGEGPPLSGGGVVTAARSGEDFKGSVSVGADCSINITSGQ